MRRFFAESIRLLSLLMLTLSALMALFWGGMNLSHYLPPGEDWQPLLWLGLLTLLGLILLVAAFQLWRGHGKGLRPAGRGLLALIVLAVLDALQERFLGGVSMGLMMVGIPAFITWLVFSLVNLTQLRDVVAYDRISVREEDMNRLEDLL